jgi:hypothetical protein
MGRIRNAALAAAIACAAGHAGAQPGTLTTSFQGLNSQAGAMFDLAAIDQITISGFDYISNSTSAPSMQQIEIYIVTDRTSFVGKDENPALWTLHETVTVQRQHRGRLTHVPMSGLTINPGETIGIYFTRNDVGSLDSIRYTAEPLGTIATEHLIFEDRGVGKAYPFGTTFDPRIWNGTIHYQPGPLVTPGACCLPGGTCTTGLLADCRAQGGIYRGGGTDCPTAWPCPTWGVMPTLPHASGSTIPFAESPGSVMHQVFASTLFSDIAPGQTFRIERMGFAPSTDRTFWGNITLRLGYTFALPGVGTASGGLSVPHPDGQGFPNAIGLMHTFYSRPTTFTSTSSSATNFQFIFDGAPFDYDPSQGNLLLEVYTTGVTSLTGMSTSRSAGSEQASRAYRTSGGGSGVLTAQALRTQFFYSRPDDGACYANCDGSTVDPVLNVDDFICFIGQFADAMQLQEPQQISHYANCDQSTVSPVLNVDDFICFIGAFAAGCP